jgi:MFS family permease
MIVGVIASVVGISVVEAALLGASAPLFLLGTIVTGVGNGLCFIGSLSLVNEIAVPSKRAELVAAYNVVAYFALSLPVVGVGLMANLFGLKTATVLFAAVLIAVSALTLASLIRQPPIAVQVSVLPVEVQDA